MSDNEGGREEASVTTEDLQRQLRASIQKLIAPSLAVRNQLAPILAIQKQLAPMIAAQRHVASFGSRKTLAFQPPQWMDDFRKSTMQVANAMPFAMAKITSGFMPVLAALARREAECARIEKAGWLPHYTTPFDVIAGMSAEADLSSILEAHYTENWSEVKAAFLTRLEKYDLDADAKATFSDALSAHEAGIYRATTRTLFPEIERVARCELHEGTMDPITSQRGLRKAAEDLCLGDIEPGGAYAMRLFNKLFDHLYARTKTEADLAAVADDPVPNRHAALHGYLPYDTRQNSINTLIMTDFIFQVVCGVKRNMRANSPALQDAAK